MIDRMLRLVTFGGLALESDDGAPAPRLRPQRLAILAVLAASERGTSRERMYSIFWPEADEERARHSLRQALYALRQELGADVVDADAVLTLDRSLVGSDVADFRAALAARDRQRAAALATGPFLDGFFLQGTAGFERWVEDERAALSADAARAILTLAKEAEAGGDLDAAADWWRRLTLLDPLSGRFALGYLKALAARGDRAGALAFARAHASVVRRELEADPDPDIRRLEADLRAIPSPEIVRVAPARPARQTSAAARELEPAIEQTTSADTAAVERAHRRRWVPVAAAVALGLAIIGVAVTRDWWGSRFGFGSSAATPTFAVGMIREDGVPDTLRIGGVLTDMLATNLARVAGLSVLANTRLFESMRPGQDTLAAGYADAARRAGATELFQGRLLAGPQWGLAMEIQRVDLASGIVKGAYRVAAHDRYSLIDSMTAAIARDLHLGSPATSISEATTASPIAYRLYEEGLRALYLYDWSGARRLMESSLQEDSTFAMAAYYLALLAPGGLVGETDNNSRALRLAARAPERERLTITANMLTLNQDPRALAVAESLATRYPNDPLALRVFASALSYAADFRGATAALERAVRIDSAAEPVDRQACSLCEDYSALAHAYFQWDSAAAAERTARRFIRARPKNHLPYDILATAAAQRGELQAVRTYRRAYDERNVATTPLPYSARVLTLAEDYDEAERLLRQALDAPRDADKGDAAWVLAILLRNEGRLEDARALAPPTTIDRLKRGAPDGTELNEALLALERADTRTATAIFTARARWDESPWAPGIAARHRAWHHTLLGMARAAAGDTLSLLQLADTVEYWGRRSFYSRDRRNAHYLRGMVLVAAKHDAAAVDEFRQAIHSPTHGFTRVNYELGKALLRLGRPAEAVPVVGAALRGGLDGSNLYMTRTDLHELLAQAFDRMGSRDSAAVHYRAVVRAWERADPIYHARRDSARIWLSRHATSAPVKAGNLARTR